VTPCANLSPGALQDAHLRNPISTIVSYHAERITSRSAASTSPQILHLSSFSTDDTFIESMNSDIWAISIKADGVDRRSKAHKKGRPEKKYKCPYRTYVVGGNFKFWKDPLKSGTESEVSPIYAFVQSLWLFESTSIAHCVVYN
jgi:hypothetical protein